MQWPSPPILWCKQPHFQVYKSIVKVIVTTGEVSSLANYYIVAVNLHCHSYRSPLCVRSGQPLLLYQHPIFDLCTLILGTFHCCCKHTSRADHNYTLYFCKTTQVGRQLCSNDSSYCNVQYMGMNCSTLLWSQSHR